MAMEIHEQRVGDVTVLRLRGRLELEEGDQALREHVNSLVRQGRARIVLDMKDVTRLDSAGIGMLAAKHLTAARAGGAIRLLRLPPRVGYLLHVTKLSTIFEIFDDEAEAVRSFATRSGARA
jgi:anti-sigma B factor antagonist